MNAVANFRTGEQFPTLSAAISAARDHDVLHVPAGEHVEDFPPILRSLTIEGVGGLAHLRTPRSEPTNGRAVLYVPPGEVVNLTLRFVEISGARNDRTNGAGVLFERGNGDLRIEDSRIHHNQNGILVGEGDETDVVLLRTEIDHNGLPLEVSVNSIPHNIYVGAVRSLSINECNIHSVFRFNQVKSRALRTTIVDTRVVDGPMSRASYIIDLPDGGIATLQGNTLVKGRLAVNRHVIHFGGERVPSYAGSRLLVQRNRFHNARADGATAVLDQTRSVPGTPAARVEIRDNEFKAIDVVIESVNGTAIGDVRDRSGEGALDPGAKSVELASAREHSLYGRFEGAQLMIAMLVVLAVLATAWLLVRLRRKAGARPRMRGRDDAARDR